MNTDQQVPVAERELPPEVATRIRTELLAATDAPRRGRRWAPYAAAAAAAGLVAGAVVLTQHPNADRPAKTKTLEATPTATPTTVPVPIHDPAWQRLAVKACWKAGGPLPGVSGPRYQEQAMRFFSARTLGQWTYVFVGNQSAILGCKVDAQAHLPRIGWGGSSFGPGPNAETEPAGRVRELFDTVTNDDFEELGGQAGTGVARVTIRWVNGRSLTAPVDNGFWVGTLSKADGPMPVPPRNEMGRVGYTITGYDKNGHVTTSKLVHSIKPSPIPTQHK